MGSSNQHAVSYLRVSGKGQVDGDGFPANEDTIKGVREVRTDSMSSRSFATKVSVERASSRDELGSPLCLIGSSRTHPRGLGRAR